MSELEYNPDTGAFTWKATSRRGFVGKSAGCLCTRDGYIRIRIHGKLELAHRLAWDKWVAEIKVNRIKKHLGQFDTFDAAVAARKAAEVEFGFHENHGKR